MKPPVSPFWLLFVENFLFGVALNATSLLPPYLTSLGASQAFVGFFNVVGILLIVLVVVLWGRSLVKLPRVVSLRWGFFLLAATSFCSWIWPTQLAWLAVLRVLGSVSQVFAWTMMMSLLYDQVPAHRRASSVALYGVGGLATNPVASLAGEAIVRTWGAPELFLFAGIMATASGLWALLFREPPGESTAPPPDKFHTVLRRRQLWPLFTLAFVFGIYYTALLTFLPGHTKAAWGEANLSVFLIPFSLISVGLRVFFGSQLDKHPPKAFLLLSYASILVAMLLLLMPATWYWIALAGLFYGAGHSILFPLLSALFVQAGGEDQKAVYSNAYLVLSLVGAVVAVPLLGALGDLVGGFWCIAAVLATAALGCVILVLPTANRPSDHSS